MTENEGRVENRQREACDNRMGEEWEKNGRKLSPKRSDGETAGWFV